MKKDNKKALYENIMASVAKEVKKALNENREDYSIARNIYDMVTKDDSSNSMYLEVVLRKGFSWSTRTLFSKNVYGQDKDSSEILNFSNECFDGDIITDSNIIIKNLTEMEKDESCKGYIVFEEVPYVRGKLVPVYKFVVKLTKVGANLANDIADKRLTRQNSKYDNNTDELEKKLTDLNVSGRMSKFLSKKYGISIFAIKDIRYMCEDFAYMILGCVNRDNMVHKKFEDDDWDVTKYPKRKGYGPMGFGPMGFGPMGFDKRGHADIKKVRDISKRIETTVFEILEDIKKNDK